MKEGNIPQLSPLYWVCSMFFVMFICLMLVLLIDWDSYFKVESDINVYSNTLKW